MKYPQNLIDQIPWAWQIIDRQTTPVIPARTTIKYLHLPIGLRTGTLPWSETTLDHSLSQDQYSRHIFLKRAAVKGYIRLERWPKNPLPRVYIAPKWEVRGWEEATPITTIEAAEQALWWFATKGS